MQREEQALRMSNLRQQAGVPFTGAAAEVLRQLEPGDVAKVACA